MATLAFMFTHPAVEDIGINVMAYGQRSQRYATSQILRHQFCFELRTVTPAPANLLGIVLCHYKHPLIISWVLSLAYFDGAEKMPSPEAYRPRVSNDNPFVESMFRTLKYRPQWPSSGFASREAARAWVEKFVLWYNTKHRHSKLNFVTPEQRHNNEDAHILAQRKKVLQAARRQHAERWNGRPVRDCRPVVATTLNPEKDAKEKLAA